MPYSFRGVNATYINAYVFPGGTKPLAVSSTNLKPNRETAMNDKLNAMLLGAFAGNALALGPHWV